jgi:hypothetical protein
MRPSYEKINYSLRPAKNIERKMMAEALLKISRFDRLDSYRYLGFGSTFFSDFILFHKTLGICKMESMEKDIKNKNRFMFNRPYRCINLLFGRSNRILAKYDWNRRTILWLDYDCSINSSVLEDIRYFCGNAQSGSVIIVTLDARPEEIGKIEGQDEEENEEDEEDRVQKLMKAIGESKVPGDIQSDADLANWKTALAYRRIIDNEIKEALFRRNGVISDGNKKIRYKQLFNFQYKDSAMMFTVGGLLYNKNEESILDECDFPSLEYLRSGKTPFRIIVPNLTMKEIRHITSQLPKNNNSELKAYAISRRDLNRFEKIYRYFPTFVEAEL